MLRPSWEKAYYRCAEAWAKMGELPEALAINQAGLRACSEHPDLVKQLRELQGIISGSAPPPEPGKLDPGRTATPAVDHPRTPAKDPGLSSGPSGKDRAHKDSGPVTTGRSKEKRGKKPSGSAPNTGGAPPSKKQPAAELQPPKKTESSLPPPGNAVPSQPHTKTDATLQPPKDTLPATPYTKFEPLSVPVVSWELSTRQLLQSCREVELQFLTPDTYTQHSSAWEGLEQPPRPDPTPVTDPSTIRDPMLSAQFDEIWCPILADSKESGSIIPPLFHYLPPQVN